MVVLGCLADARDKLSMRSGHHHQPAVEWIVIGQRNRTAHSTWNRHAVFGVPRFEVRVPVETGAAKPGHVVDSSLVQIDLAPEQLPGAIEQPFVAAERI